MPQENINLSQMTVNGVLFTIKDSAAQSNIQNIINAIVSNNSEIGSRINDLNGRSFDALIKISSNNESEIASIQDGIYKLQYVTITIEGEEEIETLDNSAILIQQGTNQYLYKDGQLSSRTKTNNTWSSWTIDTHPVTSVNGMTGAVTVSGLPTVTSADNGKILMVVNGQWQLVSPSVLYSGNGVPNNANGNNGDLYIQTD